MKSSNRTKKKRERGTQQATVGAMDAIGIAIKLQQANRLEESAKIYTALLDANPNHADALHYYGVLLHQQGKSERAVEQIRKAVALRPEYADAHNNLGNVLKELGRFEEAISAYQSVIALRPEAADPYNNLGTVLKQQKQFEAAIDSYRQAVARDPNHGEAYHNLGNLFKDLDRLDEALEAYRRALFLRPYRAESYVVLGRALCRTGKPQEACELYEKWLEREKDNPIAMHMLAAMSKIHVPARASDNYIKATFNNFADSFDQVLHDLNYQAPQLIASALAAVLPPPERGLDILDAGCGTGLCGALLRPYASRLIGVDLSAQMLAKARKRNTYDELIEGELTAFIGSSAAAWDVIASADTLIYFGDLQPVLQAAAHALRPGGYLAFSLEKAEEADAPAGITIGPHGRYGHRQDYIRQTLAEAGLVLSSMTFDDLRKEGGLDVPGIVTVARKP